MGGNRVALLGIRIAHFEELDDLPPLHRDPFDRMMLGQAIAESMPMMSVDETMRRHAARIL